MIFRDKALQIQKKMLFGGLDSLKSAKNNWVPFSKHKTIMTNLSNIGWIFLEILSPKILEDVNCLIQPTYTEFFSYKC